MCHQHKSILLWLILLLTGGISLVLSAGDNILTLQILTSVGLFSFIGCIGIAVFHHHDKEADANHCLICHCISRVRNSLPATDLLIILSMASSLLLQTAFSFTFQSHFSPGSARAPPLYSF